MSNIVIYENRSSELKMISRKSIKEVFSPLLEVWEKIISQNEPTIDFNVHYRKDFETLMCNTLRKSRIEKLGDAYYCYQDSEMWIDVCITCTYSDGKIFRFVFFKPQSKFVVDGNFNTAAIGMEIRTVDGNLCDSVTFSTIAEQDKNITLNDMFNELGLMAESKSLIDFIDKNNIRED